MRDETYGISIIGLAAGLYGIVAWIGLVHATAVGNPAGSFASNLPVVDAQENGLIVANR
ncbi:MAG: hypothetical protein JST04_07860 [Bdellovibrionales bacterium]|nr:hypothetical protein [Bdellovibrionales bacterium]